VKFAAFESFQPTGYISIGTEKTRIRVHKNWEFLGADRPNAIC